jgi:Ser/Thr protein kinase RdoA (MazF antagonist)
LGISAENVENAENGEKTEEIIMVSDNLLEFASKNYGFNKDTLNFISDSTNQIYAFQKNGKNYILRFSQRPAEYINQTKAEIGWLYYLANNHINVSLPLAADNGELVISAEDDGETYIISVYETLSGQFWDKNDPNKWNEKIFYNWGKTMGDIHRLTKDYIPANDDDVRSVFTGYETFFTDRANGIKNCPSVCKIAEELIGEMMELPKDRDSYGLIHYDVHQWNFLIDGINGDEIKVFDFDDSLYGWFALDIGIALYHGLWWGRKDDAGNDFTNLIIKNFLKGYQSANQLSGFWLDRIPMFMKYRQICKLSWFYDSENEDEHQRERICNIENDILFTGCEIDFSLFKAVP